MTGIKIVLGGLAGLVVGWALAAAATLLFGGLFGLTEFEGERSMTAVFGIGPLGGAIGFVIGLWLVLRRRR